MLQFFRNNTKILVWFFVLTLVGVFGLSSISLSKYDQYAGEVFGKKISFQEFRAFETLTRLFPPGPKISEDPQLALQYTWQQVILAHEARAQNIQVTDEEIRAKVDQLMNGESDRRISAGEYQSLLKNWRTTPHEFENGVREMIRIQKMVSGKFKPAAGAAAETGPAADEKERLAKQKMENQKIMNDYVQWMTSIYERAKFVDYSKQNNPAVSS